MTRARLEVHAEPELCLACLRSLVGEARAIAGLRVVVVDNDSRDGSARTIAAAIAAEGLDSFAELVALETNAGYAAGNNRGILHAAPRLGAELPEYVLLLNPDTLLSLLCLSSSPSP